MPMDANTAREAQKLATDRLVNLYEIDTTVIGGTDIFRFVTTVDVVIPIISLHYNGSTVEAFTLNPHAMLTGDGTIIAGSDEPEYNGTYSVTVIDPFTFTYVPSGAPLLPDATGARLVGARLNNMMVFDGNNYAPANVDVEGFEWNGTGTAPQPTLTVSNTNRVLLAGVITLRDLVGAKFKRIRTFRKNLDDGSDPSPTTIFPPDFFTINRKVTQNPMFLEFELRSSYDQESVMIPGRIAIKNSCPKRYRIWDAAASNWDYTRATCPYVGGTMFKRDGTVTTDPTEDSCGKRLSSCKLHFGNQPLPFGGVPGIGGV